MVKTLESELETLIKGAVLLLYIMVFYFQNSKFCSFKTFFLIGERTLLLTALRPWPSFEASFWSLDGIAVVALSGLFML